MTRDFMLGSRTRRSNRPKSPGLPQPPRDGGKDHSEPGPGPRRALPAAASPGQAGSAQGEARGEPGKQVDGIEHGPDGPPGGSACAIPDTSTDRFLRDRLACAGRLRRHNGWREPTRPHSADAHGSIVTVAVCATTCETALAHRIGRRDGRRGGSGRLCIAAAPAAAPAAAAPSTATTTRTAAPGTAATAAGATAPPTTARAGGRRAGSASRGAGPSGGR
jgi:hypothetical protein